MGRVQSARVRALVSTRLCVHAPRALCAYLLHVSRADRLRRERDPCRLIILRLMR